jgi:hypothetical protein
MSSECPGLFYKPAHWRALSATEQTAPNDSATLSQSGILHHPPGAGAAPPASISSGRRCWMLSSASASVLVSTGPPPCRVTFPRNASRVTAVSRRHAKAHFERRESEFRKRLLSLIVRRPPVARVAPRPSTGSTTRQGEELPPSWRPLPSAPAGSHQRQKNDPHNQHDKTHRRRRGE